MYFVFFFLVLFSAHAYLSTCPVCSGPFFVLVFSFNEVCYLSIKNTRIRDKAFHIDYSIFCLYGSNVLSNPLIGLYFLMNLEYPPFSWIMYTPSSSFT